MPITSKSAKSEIRSDLLQQLKNVDPQAKLAWSASIQKNLKSLLAEESGYWGAFINLGTEPDLNWQNVSDKIKWCFPQVEQDSLMFKYDSTDFERSKLGVQEPRDGEVIAIDQLQGVVVPGLAFSHKGHRLGRGKGYYDKNLFKFKGKKVGVCFGLSFVQELPNEPHDIFFHHIVTESSIDQVAHPEGDSKWN